MPDVATPADWRRRLLKNPGADDASRRVFLSKVVGANRVSLRIVWGHTTAQMALLGGISDPGREVVSPNSVSIRATAAFAGWKPRSAA